jgi:GxxExxY protein
MFPHFTEAGAGEMVHEQHERMLLLKALSGLVPEHRAQVLNYLRVTGLKLGLLVNFGCGPKARIERLVL